MVDFIDAGFEISRASPSAGWVAGVIGVHPWQLALFDDARTTRHVGRRSGDDALVVVQPHRQSRSRRRRLSRVGALVVLVRLRSLPRREPRCERRQARDRRQSHCPTSARSCCFPTSTASTTTGTSRACAAPAAKTSSSKNAFVPDAPHAVAPRLRVQSTAAGPRTNDGVLYRMPWSVVFNMALAASMLGSARGFIDAWIEQNADAPARPDCAPPTTR